MQERKHLERIREVEKILEEINLLPVKAETLATFPYHKNDVYFHFLLSILYYSKNELKDNFDSFSPSDFQGIPPPDFSPVNVIKRPKNRENIIHIARRGIPLPRRIQVGTEEFQIQAIYTDIMESEGRKERRVIEIETIKNDKIPPNDLKSTRLEAKIKSWILASYLANVKRPSIAFINKDNRRILSQQLVPFSTDETEKKIKDILQALQQFEDIKK